MTAAASALCACIERDKERERVFLLQLFACIERRVRERVLAVYSLFHTEKKIFSTLRRTTIALSLSHSLLILFCSLCLMLFLLFVVFVYYFSFCLLLSAPLLRCCCCFFFFYIVTNTQKQLKNNNIKKYRNRRTCWTVVVIVVAGESVVFVFVFESLFVCCFLFVENFEFWFCAKCFFSCCRFACTFAGKVSSSSPFQARFFILKITFCFSPLSFFYSWRTEKKIVYEHTNNGGGRSGRENKHKSKRVKKLFTLFVLSLCPKIFSDCFFFDFDPILIFAENV